MAVLPAFSGEGGEGRKVGTCVGLGRGWGEGDGDGFVKGVLMINVSFAIIGMAYRKSVPLDMVGSGRRDALRPIYLGHQRLR